MATLREFTAILQRDIADFERKWESDHEAMPDDFPMEMDLPEWWEQFLVAMDAGETT